jgi:hypothetical protein
MNDPKNIILTEIEMKSTTNNSKKKIDSVVEKYTIMT